MLQLKLVKPPQVEPVTLALAKQHCRIVATNTDDDALITQYIQAAREYCEHSTHRAFYNQTWKLTMDHFPLYPWWTGTARSTDRHDIWYWGVVWRGYQIRPPKPSLVSIGPVTFLDTLGNLQSLAGNRPVSGAAVLAGTIIIDANGNQQTCTTAGLLAAAAPAFSQVLNGTTPDGTAVWTCTQIGPLSANYFVDTNSEPGVLVPTVGTFWPYPGQYLPGSVNISYVAGSYGDGVAVNNIPTSVVQAILFLVREWYDNRGASSSGRWQRSIYEAADALLDRVRIDIVGYDNN